ncbi:MAG TPA: ubiquitin [Desulfosporosinus sp.]|jgi:hypothetical protein|nr:ubiquitin [Desulfosporosinus sp.]
MTTLEQVEKLRAMANISYDEARAALDVTNGDLLEAVINLEKQGKVNAPSGSGYFSSEKAADPCVNGCNTYGGQKQTKYGNGGETFTSLLKKFGKFCMNMIHKGNANHFQVLKDEESKASFPVTALALLAIFALWMVIPLIIIGLFFGYRYRFNGPDFAGNTVNDAMNNAADAAINLKKSIDK